MSVQTFEEAVSAAQQEDQQVAAIKQTFVEPLKELTKLKAQWDKQRLQFQNRLSLVHHRVQQAVTAGVNADQVLRVVGPLIRDLEGGGPVIAGLIPTFPTQLETCMANMRDFTEKQLPLRSVWLSWPSTPDRLKDNLRAIEDRLSQLESIVADGGQLQQMIERVAERKARSQAVA